MKPWSVPLFIVVGGGIWLVVTVAAIAEILKAPAEHAELAFFLALMWILLAVLAAMSRVTERLGPGR